MKQYPFYEHRKVSTIRTLVDHCADLWQNRVAFAYEQRKEMVQISFLSLQQQVDGVARWLSQNHPQKVHVAILGENSYQWILAYLSVTSCGDVAVPLDKELSPEELSGLIKASDCSVLFYSEGYRDIAEGLDCPGLTMYSMVRLDQMAAEGMAIAEAPDAPAEEDLASIVFTSGTTGQSKGVMLTHGNLCADTHGSCCNVLLKGTGMLVLPLHHTFGLVASVLAVMLQGHTVYINRSLKRIADDMRKCKPQHMFVVPLIADQFLRSIWGNARKQKKDKLLRLLVCVSDALLRIGIDVRGLLFRSVREAFGGQLQLIVSGGAAIDEKTIRSLQSFGFTVLNGYGITECSPVVAVNRNEFNRIGSVGFPLVCNEVRIAEDGEILVHGNNVMKGYYHNEQATREAFDGEWFRTGDLGSVDEEGALYIVGRKKNLIILSNGENIAAEELEAKLLACPGILETVVSGQDDVISAEVYLDPDMPDPGAAAQDHIRRLNHTLPQHKRIGNIVFRDAPFPKTTTKKIIRRKKD